MIKGDSTEYNLLEKWTKDFDCQGFMTAEVGVREGLGSKSMLDNLKNIYYLIMFLEQTTLIIVKLEM